MVYDRCSAVASYVVKFLAGRSVPFDVSQLVVATVERTSRGFRCRLCGRTLKLSALKSHLQHKHCSELVELWGRLRPRALFKTRGGRTSYMPFVFMCRVCGWSLRVELPCNAGPPSVPRKLEELLGTVIPRSCPSCGRVFDVRRVEFGFAPDS
jgi:ribosomal protein L37AE/L43A